MKQLNNKGQTLVLFVIFIPLFIFMGILVVDLANAKYESKTLDSIAKEAIRYSLKHTNFSKEDVVKLIEKNDTNLKKIDVIINEEKKEVIVTLEKETNGFFGKIINKEIYKEKSSFKGTIIDDKIKIERVL